MFISVPVPQNEPILTYMPGSKERTELLAQLEKMSSQTIEIPAIINGKEYFTGDTGYAVEPHNHAHKLAKYHKVGEKEIDEAIKSSLKVRHDWERYPFYHRTAIFRKAAELLSTKYRPIINAATMLSQSKTVHQAEIDAACELIDFWRFNTYFAQEINKQQPLISPKGEWNFSEYRALEGFVLAITPFNFTSIGGNLPTAPAIMGNTVLWKPAETAIYSNYFIMKALQEAGLPDGVINFLPGQGSKIGKIMLDSEHLAGVHFTGSTGVFNKIWQQIGSNIEKYHSYPRIVGETGGKDFIFVHPSANLPSLVTAAIRGAFEYQGQKCSAVSRLYLPQNMWKEFSEMLVSDLKDLKVGTPEDFTSFMNAVIDQKSFDKIKGYIDFAKKAKDAEIIFGGGCDDSAGYFIEPTVILTSNPEFKTMKEEIFGPVLTIYLYDDDKYVETLQLCDATSKYALTGSIFARDRNAICTAFEILRHSAGNFYINDKPTGAVVGQQPFGGARSSGTNDKAGSALNLYRWISARSVKETFVPPEHFEYPYMKKY
jgi:1-pyrroline-5-carboxylate dehydrogenase